MTAVLEGEVGSFGSLRALRAAHDELLESLAERDPGPDDYARINDFIAMAVASGRFIDTAQERRTAQGLIDYWVATLYTHPRAWTKSAEATREILQPVKARLGNFDASSVEGVIAAADAALSKMLESERQLAQDILLQLVRLPASGQKFETVSVPLSALRARGKAGHADVIVETLVQAGILSVQRDEPEDQVTLSYECLTRLWPTLRRWLDERLQFRQAAVAWKTSGHDPGALRHGRLLTRAETYSDLNDLERAFLFRSNASTHDRRAIAWGAAVIALVVVSLLAIYAYNGWQEADRQKVLVQEERDRALDERAEFAKAAKACRELLIQDPPKLEKCMEEVDKVFAPRRLTAIRPIEPGVSIGPIGSKKAGSACCFAKDSEGQVYMLTGAQVLQEPLGTKVVQPSSIDGGSEADVIGVIRARAGNGATLGASRARIVTTASVKLNDGIAGKNWIPGLGAFGIVKNEDAIATGTRIIFVGRDSGRREGFVRFADKLGIIHVRAETEPGDIGAPVLTDDGHELIGMIIGRKQMDVWVAPIAPLLEELGLNLLPSK